MREALATWLAEVGLGSGDIEVDQIVGGASNLTYRVRSGDDDWILRRPPKFVTATSNDMAREWTVLRALAPTDVPVPRIIRTCDDPAVLGAPFYLMERLDGVVFRSVDEVSHLDAEQSRACTADLVDTLAALHAIDPAKVGLGEFGRPAGFLERQVRRWSKQWELTKFAEVPEIDETARRLSALLPPEQAPAIVHGDYSFNNTVYFRNPPTKLQGVLDWELSTLGDPLTDVGLLAFYWDAVAEEVLSVKQAHRANPGFGTTAELLDRYAASSGRDLSQIDFYIALATFKMAVIIAGACVRFRESDPQRATQLEGKARRLAAVALAATDRLRHQ